MADQDMKAVRAEVLKFGPSPFIPNEEGPMLILFHNELESIIGTAETTEFGKPAPIFIILTTFRIALYKWNKHGDDAVLSYWFNLDCSDDPFHDPEGFLIAGIETSPPEYRWEESKDRPSFTWETSYLNPDGLRKTARSVEIFPLLYNHHHENRYVDVRKMISIPGYTPNGEESYPALKPLILKFYSAHRGPMGKLKMTDLEIMHHHPKVATAHTAGVVPEDCELHESKENRPRRSYQTKSKIKKGTGKTTKPALNKKVNKPPFKWKKVASRALDVGTKLKGGLDVVGKAVSTAAAAGSDSVKDLAEKGTESVKKASASIRETTQDAFSEGNAGAGLPVHLCPACGAPMRSGALFCGKCGRKKAEKVVNEVKEHIKGKVEDALVEKAKAKLEEEKPSPEVAEDIRLKPISKSGLPANIIKPLEKARFKTLGDLADFLAEKPDDMEKIKGIGPAAIKKIKQTVSGVPAKKVVEPMIEPAQCQKCGQPLQKDWSFCPNCQEPIARRCPHCGKKVEKDWKFCPMCTAALE